METSVLNYVIVGFATWYVSFALTSTHGPGGVFEWVRDHVWHGRRVIPNGEGTFTTIERPKNGLLDCPVCLAFWVALILLLVPMGIIVQALAVAGAAMLAHSWSGWRFGQ